MKSSKLIILLMLLSISFSYVFISYGQLETTNYAQTAIHNAYKTLVDAYNSGADIGKLTDQLNLALNLFSQSQTLTNTNPLEAQRLASQAQGLAQNVTTQALSAKEGSSLLNPLMLVGFVVALLVGGVLVYVWGPKTIWKMWLRLRKNYRVKAKNSPIQNKGFIVTGEQVCALILGMTIIVAFFVASPLFLPKGTGETFSELGILGPNNKLGDYPSVIVASETVYLNVYVGNQMGKPIDYIVMIKLGDNETSINPAPLQPIQQFEAIVPSNGTWTFPFNVTMSKVGLNQRLIFELWTYNETINQNQYHERWGQIWLNVTAPAV
jgi:hypothetical protein